MEKNMQEVPANLAAAKGIGTDAAVASVLSERDGIFTSK